MRKAGELLKEVLNKARGIDEAYAEAVYNASVKHMPNDTLKTMFGVGAGTPLIGPHVDPEARKSMTQKELLLNQAAVGGIIGVNAGIRYGIPIAGAGALANGIGNAYDALSGVPVLPQDQTNQPPGY